MSGKPLSKQAKFKDALILKAPYSSNPGVNGWCELAMTTTKTERKFWSWIDEWGTEITAIFPIDMDLSEIVESLIHNESLMASVSPSEIEVSNDSPPLGELLRLIWGDSEDNKIVASLLSHLSVQTLVNLCATKNGLLDHELHELLLEIHCLMDDEGLDLVDLPYGIDLKKPTPKSIYDRFRKLLFLRTVDIAKDVENSKTDVSPFLDSIGLIVDKWCSGKPTKIKYPGGGYFDNPSIRAVRNFLLAYVSEHGYLPEGKHTVTHKAPFGSQSIFSFVVDFDALTK